MAVDPDKLFAFASGVARRAEDSGRGTQYPTVRECAKRFRATNAQVSESINDYQGKGYLGVAVALRCNGGVADLGAIGNCLVEAYDDEVTAA